MEWNGRQSKCVILQIIFTHSYSTVSLIKRSKTDSSVFWIITLVTGLSRPVEDSMRLSSQEGWTPTGDERVTVTVCASWFMPQTHGCVAWLTPQQLPPIVSPLLSTQLKQLTYQSLWFCAISCRCLLLDKFLFDEIKFGISQSEKVYQGYCIVSGFVTYLQVIDENFASGFSDAIHWQCGIMTLIIVSVTIGWWEKSVPERL